MNSTSVEVWFVDDEGHDIGYMQWSPTELSVSDDVYWQSERVDFSNPDEGITVIGGFLSYLPDELGRRFEVTKQKSEILSAEELERAGVVSVNGQVVLVRAGEGEEADFRCGLRWPTDGGEDEDPSPGPASESGQGEGGDEGPSAETAVEPGLVSGVDENQAAPSSGSPEDGFPFPV